MQSAFGTLVKGHMDNLWQRLRPLPAAPLVVRRRYLIEVPRPLPAAPLAVRRTYLIVVLRPVPRRASRIPSRGTQADAHGATQVLDRNGQAVARGICLSQVLDRGAQQTQANTNPNGSEFFTGT
jgi:hypothetical protein